MVERNTQGEEDRVGSDIEKVLRKIVENLEYAVNDEDGEIIESGVNALIHALLNSEEVVIKERKSVRYGCYCELAPYQKPDECVIDQDIRSNCAHAQRHAKKEDCEYWKPIKED